jgi:single-strand DNA-binding protein
MRSVNKVILIGNLTRDPELRQTPSGQSVVAFGIATNREWMTRDGRKMNSAEFHECVAWAKLADICAQYLKKGKLVYVEGYLKTRSWDTPEGVKKFRTEIIVQDMIMLDSPGASNRTHAEASAEAPVAAPAAAAAPAPVKPEPKKEVPNQSVAEDPKKESEDSSLPPPSAPPSTVSIDGDLGI